MNRKSTSALALVATSAALSVGLVTGGTASAQPATPTKALPGSTISIRIPHSRIQAGQTTKVLGDLHIRGAGQAEGRTVTLEAEPAGATSFSPITTAVAGQHGGLNATVQPNADTKYRWYYAGASDSRPSRSGTGRVVLIDHKPGGRKLYTSLSIRGAHRIPLRGGDDLVKGRLRTHNVGMPHRMVDLMARSQGQTTWQLAGQHLTDSKGEVRFPVHPTAPTAYRLVFEGSPVFRPSHSGVVHIGVRPTVTASASPTQVNPGETVGVSGSVSESGAPVAGATVDLVARAAGHQGHHVVGSGTTATDGSVTIYDTPNVTTVYRLVVRHTAGVPNGASAPVRVAVNGSSSLSIRGRHIQAGFLVSGVLRSGGHTLHRTLVDLQELAPDGSTWVTVTSRITNNHGKVQFLEPGTTGVYYRLSYAGDAHTAPCVSGTVAS